MRIVVIWEVKQVIHDMVDIHLIVRVTDMVHENMDVNIQVVVEEDQIVDHVLAHDLVHDQGHVRDQEGDKLLTKLN